MVIFRFAVALVLSLPVRGAWIEMILLVVLSRLLWSLPVRGAWIEIKKQNPYNHETKVAPRKGSVD